MAACPKSCSLQFCNIAEEVRFQHMHLESIAILKMFIILGYIVICSRKVCIKGLGLLRAVESSPAFIFF